ncbi:hypothetical protein D3OALGB2SA_5778 [Olavius algarvensis associated proteobacterium Delta 3]|nr:hypothetical protein D3OALGB2SA_5778 [Olavius algarvensis associated proteobacterium Delta 3]
MVQYEPLKRVSGTRQDFDRQVATVCQECTVGCGLTAYVKDEGIVDLQGREDHPISKGRLCPKGSAFVQGLAHSQRITIPAYRNTLTRGFESATSWEQALDQLAERLRRLKDKHGAESLIIGCDPEAGLDFYLGARRFARLWGTPHVYHPWEETEQATRLAQELPVSPSSEWIESRCLLLVDADLAVTHPVAFGRVLKAQGNGAKLIVADSRYTASMSKADLAVPIRPGSGNLLGLYLLKQLLDEGLEHKDAIEAGFEQADNWQASFDRMVWDGVENHTHVTREDVLNISRFISSKHPVTVITGKRLAHSPDFGIWRTLAAAMGWIGHPGGGWYPMDAGLPRVHPDTDIEEPPPENFSPRLAPFPYQNRSGSNEELLFQGLIGSGNCLDDFFLPVRRQSPKMELIVHFGAFPNETCQQAHMVFSAAAWAERDGLCWSIDRALQWAPRILPPADASHSGLGFWAGLAQRLGWDEFFPWIRKDGRADRFEFYRWLLKRDPQTASCDLSQLRDNQDLFFWTDKTEFPEAGETPQFYTQNGRIKPVDAPELPTAEDSDIDDGEYPLYFQSTRIVTRGGDAGNWWPWTAELEDVDAIQIHPDTAGVLGIENGDAVVVNSPKGCLEGRAWISRMVDRRMVWSPRRLEGDHVLLLKKGQSADEALNLLKENTP